MQLNIRVVEAKDLEVMDFFGSVDPYCLIQLTKGTLQKTKVVKDCLTPKFNAEFKLPVADDQDTLHILMRDQDVGSADDEIGKLVIPLPTLKVGEVIDKWFTLTPAPGVKKAAQLKLVLHLAQTSDQPFVAKTGNNQGTVNPNPTMPQPGYPQQQPGYPQPQPGYPQQQPMYPPPQPGYPQQQPGYPQQQPMYPQPQIVPQPQIIAPQPMSSGFSVPINVPFFIFSQANPNLCLDIEGGNQSAGAKLIVWNFSGQPNQQFIYNGTNIISAMSRKVLDISGGEKQGGGIVQWDPNGGSNQQWRFSEDGTIRSPSGLCMDIYDNRVTNGTHIIAWTSNGQANQKWRVSTSR